MRSSSVRRVRQRHHPVQVLVHDGLVEGDPVVRGRDLVEGRLGSDPGRDLDVGGRHDLHAVAEIDLVPVVLRRVVAGRDDDASISASSLDRISQHGRGQLARKDLGGEPGACGDGGSQFGERLGVAPGVIPDHDRGPAGVLDVLGEASSGLGHNDVVHGGGAGAQGSTQPGGAERQRSGERDGQTALIVGVDPRLKFRAGLRVGVLGKPGGGLGQQVVHSRSRMLLRRSDRRVAASLPACRTSA